MPALNLLSFARSRRVALGMLVFAMCPVGLSPAVAQSSIKILVNDEPITSYDIKNRSTMLSVFTRGQQGEKQAIDQLIDEALMMQEAARRNVKVSEEEVEQEFAERASQTRMNSTQFSQAMRQSGIDPQTFRDFLQANMAWREVVRARFRATVDVTEQDIAAALTGRPAEGEERTLSEYMLQQIVFVVPSGAGASIEAERRNEATAFRRGFTSCDSSVQQASGRPGVVVRPTVRREESQVTGELRDAILALPVGGITEPQRIPEGFQLVALCEKNAIAGQTQATEAVREEISSERGKLLARRYLRDLRSDAVIEYR